MRNRVYSTHFCQSVTVSQSVCHCQSVSQSVSHSTADLEEVALLKDINFKTAQTQQLVRVSFNHVTGFLRPSLRSLFVRCFLLCRCVGAFAVHPFILLRNCKF